MATTTRGVLRPPFEVRVFSMAVAARAALLGSAASSRAAGVDSAGWAQGVGDLNIRMMFRANPATAQTSGKRRKGFGWP